MSQTFKLFDLYVNNDPDQKNNAFIYIKHWVNMNKILNLNSKYLYILTSKIYHTAKVIFNTNTVY